MSSLTTFLATLAAAAVVAGLTTPLFAAYARARGLVVAPRDDRWHRRATPLLGGAAMALAVGVVAAVAGPQTQTVLVVLAGAAAAFALGLLDDFRHIAPTTKLVGQALIGSFMFVGGVRVEIVTFPPAAFLLTVFWVVAIMNAVNLLDNMDGLAAGIAVIGACFLGLAGAQFDRTSPILAAATAGAGIGFLIHNFSPARVFMGDAGSLLLGQLLASIALLHTASGAANLTLAVLVPLAVLALPLFDTAFVTASRRLAGIPISQGGRDHTSHRLAALGLSDRAAVLILYALAVLLAALGVVADAVSTLITPLIVLATVGLVLFGVFLHDVEVYGARRRLAGGIVRGPLGIYLRFGAEVGLDLVLLTTAYYLAWAVRFEGVPVNLWMRLFVESVPLVVALQLTALVVLGVYRSLWRYLGISDVVAIVKAIAAGTAAAALGVLVVFRFQDYSRAVFIFDAVLAAVLVIAARAMLLWLRHWAAARSVEGRRVLVVGAGDAGAFALRMLTRSRDARYRVVGFLDDDPGKRYRRVAGVPIIGQLDDLDKAIERHRADLVIIALDDNEVSVAKVRHICDGRGVEHRELLVPV